MHKARHVRLRLEAGEQLVVACHLLDGADDLGPVEVLYLALPLDDLQRLNSLIYTLEGRAVEELQNLVRVQLVENDFLKVFFAVEMQHNSQLLKLQVVGLLLRYFAAARRHNFLELWLYQLANVSCIEVKRYKLDVSKRLLVQEVRTCRVGVHQIGLVRFTLCRFALFHFNFYLDGLFRFLLRLLWLLGGLVCDFHNCVSRLSDNVADISFADAATRPLNPFLFLFAEIALDLAVKTHPFQVLLFVFRELTSCYGGFLISHVLCVLHRLNIFLDEPHHLLFCVEVYLLLLHAGALLNSHLFLNWKRLQIHLFHFLLHVLLKLHLLGRYCDRHFHFLPDNLSSKAPCGIRQH